ncbi:MAG: hypothetical protein M3015_13245 [Bacteroidota bacterium]|nr:hypothetical protein [Bacteroidota bacterium]
MDHLEEFTKATNTYTWKDIIIGIIFFPVILPLFLLKRFFNKVEGSSN